MGLEPTMSKAPDPKSGGYANSPTRAFIFQNLQEGDTVEPIFSAEPAAVDLPREVQLPHNLFRLLVGELYQVFSIFKELFNFPSRSPPFWN